MISATPPLIKQPQSAWQNRIQEFKKQMRMPQKGRNQRGIFPIITEIESMKATQLTGSKSAVTTPPGGTERVHSVPFYNIESHQPLYSEKIFTQKVGKDQEGFNN